jgi:hypothetical protein
MASTRRFTRSALAAVLATAAIAPAVAQAQAQSTEPTITTVPASSSEPTTTVAGRNAIVAGSQVGQRVAGGRGAQAIEPHARLQTRVQNRVQNRLRNRVDRYYDPTANTTSPYEVAREEAQAGTDAESQRKKGR